jgi:hypothetical protein
LLIAWLNTGMIAHSDWILLFSLRSSRDHLLHYSTAQQQSSLRSGRRLWQHDWYVTSWPTLPSVFTRSGLHSGLGHRVLLWHCLAWRFLHHSTQCMFFHDALLVFAVIEMLGEASVSDSGCLLHLAYSHPSDWIQQAAWRHRYSSLKCKDNFACFWGIADFLFYLFYLFFIFFLFFFFFWNFSNRFSHS